MASQFDQFFSEAGTPALLQQLGETVTLNPSNDPAHGYAITAILDQANADGELRIVQQGETITQHATLTLSTAIAIGERDSITANGITWKVNGAPSSAADLQSVELEYVTHKTKRMAPKR